MRRDTRRARSWPGVVLGAALFGAGVAGSSLLSPEEAPRTPGPTLAPPAPGAPQAGPADPAERRERVGADVSVDAGTDAIRPHGDRGDAAARHGDETAARARADDERDPAAAHIDEELRATEQAVEASHQLADALLAEGATSPPPRAPRAARRAAAPGVAAAVRAACEAAGASCLSSSECCAGLVCEGGIGGFGTRGRCIAPR